VTKMVLSAILAHVELRKANSNNRQLQLTAQSE